MNERELTRTALVVPPRGRALLCVWAGVPCALLSPFLFWRGPAAGGVFCALWAAWEAGVWVRAVSFAAALGARTLTIYAGVTFPTRRAVPRAAVTDVRCLRTPLARWAGVSSVVVTAPGARLWLPAVPAAQAERLAALLLGGAA